MSQNLICRRVQYHLCLCHSYFLRRSGIVEISLRPQATRCASSLSSKFLFYSNLQPCAGLFPFECIFSLDKKVKFSTARFNK